MSMACLIISLPREIQLSILAFSEDLDDALSLSQTCRLLRSVHATHQKFIERSIIISSHVYEYDFCLSHLLKMNEHLAATLRLSKSDYLLREQRLSRKVLLAAIKTDWSRYPLTDDNIDAITLRWRQMGYLRGLYLDDILSKEFDLFRARFPVTLPEAIRKTIVEPGLIRSSTSSSRLQRSRQYSEGFRARFYKSLCLQSMAVATLKLAKMAPEYSEELDHDHYTDFIENTFALACKRSVIIGGPTIFLTEDIKQDCLETSDFLYLFLLRKIIPFERLDSWTNEDAHRWFYVRDVYGRGRTKEWYDLLEHSRSVLQPHDIYDLIKHQAWRPDSTFPSSKSTYMRVRGMFDVAYEGGDHPELYYWHTRAGMIQEFRLDHYRHTVETEDPCWWDHVRVMCGSPFLPGAVSKFQETSAVVWAECARRKRAEKKAKMAETEETKEIAETAGNRDVS